MAQTATRTSRDIFNEIADGAALFAKLAAFTLANIDARHPTPYDLLDFWAIEDAADNTNKAHKLAVLLRKLYDGKITSDAAYKEFEAIKDR